MIEISFSELEKTIKFINNNDINKNYKEIFSKEVYANMKEAHKKNKVYTLTNEQVNAIIKTFIKDGMEINANTPAFIRADIRCAKATIKVNAYSADYIIWKSFNKEEKNLLIKSLIKEGYVLHLNSCDFLCSNVEIALNSIKVDKNTLKYVNDDIRVNKEVFKYAVKKGCNLNCYYMASMPLEYFDEPYLMAKGIERLGFTKNGIRQGLGINSKAANKYFKRVTELYATAIHNKPTIKKLKKMIDVYAEKEWIDFRSDHLSEYTNIFGKICTELKENDYKTAIKKLYFLTKMEDVLDNKYDILCKAMKDYYDIVHNIETTANFDEARDTIGNLSALYISLSKEEYKKNWSNGVLSKMKCFFETRLDNPKVYKKLSESVQYKKFMEQFLKYRVGGKTEHNITEFIDSLIEEYGKFIDSGIVLVMINHFVMFEESKLSEFIAAPRGWNDYNRYKNASKLINRLNSGFIKYEDQELTKYRNIIKYDPIKKVYFYCGPEFTERSLKRYIDYDTKLLIYNEIKQKIIFKSRELVTDEEIIELKNSNCDYSKYFPFNDEYYEFKPQFNLMNLTSILKPSQSAMNSTIETFEPNTILDDEKFNFLLKINQNNPIAWLIILLQGISDRGFRFTDSFDLSDVRNQYIDMAQYIDNIKLLINDFDDYKSIMNACELGPALNRDNIAILGIDIINSLSTYRSYTNGEVSEIVNSAANLIVQMTGRDKSTVPFISGETENYRYSLYDSLDTSILLSGINTNACFRIDGNDNDFLHYCALNKNGFVIKITDLFGNFIGRASGFRNGNCVFINQLRTIYDKGGVGYGGTFGGEKSDIIKTFFEACEDIVRVSQNNADEKAKIDFVFVNKSYTLMDYDTNDYRITSKVSEKIGEFPVNNKDEDWIDFVNNTKGLQEIDNDDDWFTTDYGNYDILCVALSKKAAFTLLPEDLVFGDAEAVYSRKRNRIIAVKYPSADILRKINMMRSIYALQQDLDDDEYECEYVEIPDDATVVLGDDWYIIFNGKERCIENCIISDDDNAAREFAAAKFELSQVSKPLADLNDAVERIEKEKLLIKF